MFDHVSSRAANSSDDLSLVGIARQLSQTAPHDDLPVHSLPLGLQSVVTSWNLEQSITRVVSFPIQPPSVTVQSYKFHATPLKAKPTTAKQLAPRVKLAEVPPPQQAEVLLNEDEIALPELPDSEETIATASDSQEFTPTRRQRLPQASRSRMRLPNDRRNQKRLRAQLHQVIPTTRQNAMKHTRV